jgi:hypothetical protein
MITTDDILTEDYLLKIIRDPSLIKADWRDLKLRLMLSDIDSQLIPDIDSIRYKQDSFFKREEHYWSIASKVRIGIITGSLSLKAFGFISRAAKDVDIIVSDRVKVKDLNLNQHRYPESDSDLESLGYISFTKSGIFGSVKGMYEVDFFENKNATFIEKDGLKFHHPFEVMDKKLQILQNRGTSDRVKDIQDFYSFRNVLRKKYLV